LVHSKTIDARKSACGSLKTPLKALWKKSMSTHNYKTAKGGEGGGGERGGGFWKFLPSIFLFAFLAVSDEQGMHGLAWPVNGIPSASYSR
jgi:hypothetical protein